MQFTFDSIDELNAFLNWSRNYGERTAELVVAGVSGSIQPCTSDVTYTTHVHAADTPPAAETASTVPPPETPHPGDSQVEQAARRKRRTKAEIAADEKAAADAAATKSQEPTAEATETPADATTAPDGANPFAAAEPAAETPANPTAEPDAADTTVTPFQHLTRAREFIAKHGMPKYNESFAKAGLDANVMGYSAYQRALHMDALAALEVA